MAELASGAVSSLLGVIRNEALLLGRVRHDVQFIREEMESMQSFLTHLSKKAPGGGDHDEQIRTWMNQVRLLAQDSNNCIDMYLYRGNPDLHLARGGLRPYVAWLPWFMHKMVAQHRAAIQLRALRERARDIGERRLRYGVEVPAKGVGADQSPAGVGLTLGAASSSVAHASAASGDEEEDNGDQLMVAMAAADHFGASGVFFQPRTPEDNVRMKLTEWTKNVAQGNTAVGKTKPSVAIVALDKEETLAIAKKASDMWEKDCKRGRSVLVDIPAVHYYWNWLRTRDILYYILRVLQSAKSQPQPEEEVQVGVEKKLDTIFSEKWKLFREIDKDIQAMKVDDKLLEIKEAIKQMKEGQLQLTVDQMSLLEFAKDEPLGVFLRALWLLKHNPVDSAATTNQGYESKDAKLLERKGATLRSREDVIKETAKKLKDHMEENAPENQKPKEHSKEEARTEPIHLDEAHYEHILREVFPPVTIKKPPEIQEQATAVSATSTIILVEDQIKDMIRKVLQELQENKSVIKLDKVEHQDGESMKELGTAGLQEKITVKELGKVNLQEDKSVKKQDTAANKSSQGCIPDALIAETMEKIEDIQWQMKGQLKIRRIMDKINDSLTEGDGQILVIIKLDKDFVSGWEDTKNAFSMFNRIAGVLMLTFEQNIAEAKEYCWPLREPIYYSPLGLYRDTALELTQDQMTEDSQQICLDILEKCKQHEFCMKIFVHALNANPNRSKEELRKLDSTLQQVTDNSMDNIASKMFKFSYSDLPNEYKSCLLYLAIFPRRQRIRRSTLVGRLVVEGLITKEDWASSVRHANRCFDALVNQWLIYPADIGATGKIKSCVIGDQVHAFITKIARKRRIVETRLSHHLARYFSIFNDLRLRGSDRIDRFFEKLYEESSRVSLIKVLDLEGCQCFGGKNQRYLKHICRTMLLLKYLSLRGTDVTQLPSEINNLRELEVLDIRQTNVHASATVDILLLKLKRLLAGRIVLNPGEGSTELLSVKVPDKVEKMLNMEVLSNVQARNRQDLKDIGKLWQLRKLGVVIEHKDSHLRNLLRAISDLHECLKSLSITLPNIHKDQKSDKDSKSDKDPKSDEDPKSHKDPKSDEDPKGDKDPKSDEDPSTKEFTQYILKHYEHGPNLLESLSITGTTQRVNLLQQLTKDSDELKLAKVTLTRTKLKQADLKVLGKLPTINCLRLRDKAYMDSKITFSNEEFKQLKYFLVEGSNMNDISFDGGALQLEKIVLCSTEGLQSLSGVEGLQDLKEVELRNSNTLSWFNKAKHISKVTLCHTILSQDEVEILAKIPNMHNLVLQEISYVQSQLIFYRDDFPRLNLLIIDNSVISSIGFTSQSASKLEKIIWSYTKGTLSGIENIEKLKELEFNGDFVPDEVKEALKKNKNKPKLVHNKPEKQYQEAGKIAEKKDARRIPLFWKKED